MLFLIVPELYQSFSAIGREMSYARVRIPQLLDEATALLPMFESEIASIKDSFCLLYTSGTASFRTRLIDAVSMLTGSDLAAKLRVQIL